MQKSLMTSSRRARVISVSEAFKIYRKQKNKDQEDLEISGTARLNLLTIISIKIPENFVAYNINIQESYVQSKKRFSVADRLKQFIFEVSHRPQ